MKNSSDHSITQIKSSNVFILPKTDICNALTSNHTKPAAKEKLENNCGCFITPFEYSDNKIRKRIIESDQPSFNNDSCIDTSKDSFVVPMCQDSSVVTYPDKLTVSISQDNSVITTLQDSPVVTSILDNLIVPSSSVFATDHSAVNNAPDNGDNTLDGLSCSIAPDNLIFTENKNEAILKSIENFKEKNDLIPTIVIESILKDSENYQIGTLEHSNVFESEFGDSGNHPTANMELSKAVELKFKSSENNFMDIKQNNRSKRKKEIYKNKTNSKVLQTRKQSEVLETQKKRKCFMTTTKEIKSLPASYFKMNQNYFTNSLLECKVHLKNQVCETQKQFPLLSDSNTPNIQKTAKMISSDLPKETSETVESISHKPIIIKKKRRNRKTDVLIKVPRPSSSIDFTVEKINSTYSVIKDSLSASGIIFKTACSTDNLSDSEMLKNHNTNKVFRVFNINGIIGSLTSNEIKTNLSTVCCEMINNAAVKKLKQSDVCTSSTCAPNSEQHSLNTSKALVLPKTSEIILTIKSSAAKVNFPLFLTATSKTMFSLLPSSAATKTTISPLISSVSCDTVVSSLISPTAKETIILPLISSLASREMSPLISPVACDSTMSLLVSPTASENVALPLKISSSGIITCNNNFDLQPQLTISSVSNETTISSTTSYVGIFNSNPIIMENLFTGAVSSNTTISSSYCNIQNNAVNKNKNIIYLEDICIISENSQKSLKVLYSDSCNNLKTNLSTTHNHQDKHFQASLNHPLNIQPVDLSKCSTYLAKKNFVRDDLNVRNDDDLNGEMLNSSAIVTKALGEHATSVNKHFSVDEECFTKIAATTLNANLFSTNNILENNEINTLSKPLKEASIMKEDFTIKANIVSNQDKLFNNVRKVLSQYCQPLLNKDICTNLLPKLSATTCEAIMSSTISATCSTMISPTTLSATCESTILSTTQSETSEAIVSSFKSPTTSINMILSASTNLICNSNQQSHTQISSVSSKGPGLPPTSSFGVFNNSTSVSEGLITNAVKNSNPIISRPCCNIAKNAAKTSSAYLLEKSSCTSQSTLFHHQPNILQISYGIVSSRNSNKSIQTAAALDKLQTNFNAIKPKLISNMIQSDLIPLKPIVVSSKLQFDFVTPISTVVSSKLQSCYIPIRSTMVTKLQSNQVTVNPAVPSSIFQSNLNPVKLIGVSNKLKSEQAIVKSIVVSSILKSDYILARSTAVLSKPQSRYIAIKPVVAPNNLQCDQITVKPIVASSILQSGLMPVKPTAISSILKSDLMPVKPTVMSRILKSNRMPIKPIVVPSILQSDLTKMHNTKNNSLQTDNKIASGNLLGKVYCVAPSVSKNSANVLFVVSNNQSGLKKYNFSQCSSVSSILLQPISKIQLNQTQNVHSSIQLRTNTDVSDASSTQAFLDVSVTQEVSQKYLLNINNHIMSISNISSSMMSSNANFCLNQKPVLPVKMTQNGPPVLMASNSSSVKIAPKESISLSITSNKNLSKEFNISPVTHINAKWSIPSSNLSSNSNLHLKTIKPSNLINNHILPISNGLAFTLSLKGNSVQKTSCSTVLMTPNVPPVMFTSNSYLNLKTIKPLNLKNKHFLPISSISSFTSLPKGRPKKISNNQADQKTSSLNVLMTSNVPPVMVAPIDKLNLNQKSKVLPTVMSSNDNHYLNKNLNCLTVKLSLDRLNKSVHYKESLKGSVVANSKKVLSVSSNAVSCPFTSCSFSQRSSGIFATSNHLAVQTCYTFASCALNSTVNVTSKTLTNDKMGSNSIPAVVLGERDKIYHLIGNKRKKWFFLPNSQEISQTCSFLSLIGLENCVQELLHYNSKYSQLPIFPETDFDSCIIKESRGRLMNDNQTFFKSNNHPVLNDNQNFLIKDDRISPLQDSQTCLLNDKRTSLFKKNKTSTFLLDATTSSFKDNRVSVKSNQTPILPENRLLSLDDNRTPLLKENRTFLRAKRVSSFKNNRTPKLKYKQTSLREKGIPSLKEDQTSILKSKETFLRTERISSLEGNRFPLFHNKQIILREKRVPSLKDNRTLVIKNKQTSIKAKRISSLKDDRSSIFQNKQIFLRAKRISWQKDNQSPILKYKQTSLRKKRVASLKDNQTPLLKVKQNFLSDKQIPSLKDKYLKKHHPSEDFEKENVSTKNSNNISIFGSVYEPHKKYPLGYVDRPHENIQHLINEIKSDPDEFQNLNSFESACNPSLSTFSNLNETNPTEQYLYSAHNSFDTPILRKIKEEEDSWAINFQENEIISSEGLLIKNDTTQEYNNETTTSSLIDGPFLKDNYQYASCKSSHKRKAVPYSESLLDHKKKCCAVKSSSDFLKKYSSLNLFPRVVIEKL
ncbi:uncharacterized protein LOC124805918 [Hydra vulgaris]|uniref:Uncharacterized protein LOC124805918 n=1 Tax=Hydra vulgaris TaxID=6087 RepID=A0ABM4DIN5_HYDVU